MDRYIGRIPIRTLGSGTRYDGCVCTDSISTAADFQSQHPHISREYRACVVCETYEDGGTDGRTDARAVDIINVGAR